MDCRTHPLLTLTSLPLLVAGQLRLSFTLSLGFALNDPQSRIIPPGEAWEAFATALDPEGIPDMGLPKPAAEWLLAGSACAPAGTETTGLPVDVTVGNLQRRFLVAGDAEDDRVSAPSPRPFRNMPLSWNRTWGGTDQPDNPLGCGLVRENGILRLPNVTDRDLPSGLPGSASPACPGPMGFWPARMTGLGTYDNTWLHTRWPGVPDDFDWSFYHLAQPCQRFSGYLSGCEHFRVTNMHPDHAVIEGRLPCLRVRLFADYGGEQKPDWREAAVHADTLWLLPNALAGLILWHTTLPSVDERGTDIFRIVAALEAADEAPRPAEDFLAAPFMPVTEAAPEPVPPTVPDAAPEPEATPVLPVPEMAVPAMPAVAVPVLPQAPPDPDPNQPQDQPQARQAELARMVAGAKEDMRTALPEINAMLARQGLPLVQAEDVLASLDQQASEAAAMLDMPEPDLSDMLRQAGLPDDFMQKFTEIDELPMPEPKGFPSPEAFRQAAEQYVDTVCAKIDASEATRNTLLSGLFPERLFEEQQVLDSQVAELEQQLGLGPMDAVKARLAALPEPDGDMTSLAYLEQAESILGLEKGSATGQFIKMAGSARTELYSPDMLPLADVAGKFPDQAGAFARLQQAIAQLTEQPPEGLFDLRSLGLAAGLRPDALAELVALDPMPMGPPTPEEQAVVPPVLPDVPAPLAAPEPEPPAPQPEFVIPYDKDSLLAALAAGIPLEGVPLDGMDLRGAGLSGVCLSGLLLDRARCDNADFSGCDLTGTRFSGASLCGAKLAGANLTGASFAEADLTGADLTAARCEQADFTRARLKQACFAAAVCHHADFSGAGLSQSRWTGAQGKDVTFGPCRGAGADFSGAQLPGCAFEGAVLDQVLFADADLTSGTFQNSVLTETDFSRAGLRNLRVYDCRLAACRMAEADLSDCGWLRVTAEALDARNVTATGATFEECTLLRSDWACASARRARWLCCDLRGSRLDRLDLLDGALRGTHVGDASLAGASLFGADLYRMGINNQTVLLGTDLGDTCLTMGEL